MVVTWWIVAFLRCDGNPELTACHYVSAIFGQSLNLTLRYDKGGPGRKVPTFVEMCVDFLTKHGLEQEGLFRYDTGTALVTLGVILLPFSPAKCTLKMIYQIQ